jgi:Spy/CpxP family protein refolding chaperone
MISFRTVQLPMFALMMFTAVAGCSGESASGSGADTANQANTVAQNDTTNTNPAPQQGGPMMMHHGPSGPDMLIHAALREPINLTADQRTTIEGLAKSLRGDRPAWDATKAKELATQVRAGNVTSSPFGATPDATKMAAHKAASATALTTLHDTLSATQRTALVDSIESHQAKGRPDHLSRPDFANGAPHGGDHMMAPFGGDLNLTDAQKQQLHAKMEANRPAKPNIDFAAMKAAMTAKLETFKADSFDANAFLTPPAGVTPPSAPTTNPLQDLVSILTPAQREQLAQKIEAGPPAHMQQ